MYAVIAAGGKQHRVEKGEVLRIEKIEAATGESVDFDDVLMLADGDDIQLGAPGLDGARVTAEVVAHGRADKVKIIKFRRRKHSMKRQGHRQWFTDVKITDILTSGAKKKAAPKKEEKPAAKKAAPKKPAAAKKTGGDDLTRISGVGPVIVGKLAEQGITTFEQVAAFTKEDIDRIDDALNFKGRIERDNWVEQAKEFAAEK